jgi:hypothetical protein
LPVRTQTRRVRPEAKDTRAPEEVMAEGEHERAIDDL